ncbi:hypothetical protein M413DRAFT_442926 [Hebeloma cylindrosporum]|uniref:Small-subunit processome Utp12 domain-containing protein n=1 Tax=Hebeloma cylindrosporum TaxID=76867 RepID=A0A0C3CME2_HEBCY|nr:hypothetical protein M413DRAFT_442926 [Hebeloma cylindrosporum h7]
MASSKNASSSYSKVQRYAEPKSVGLGSDFDSDEGEEPQDVNGDLQPDLAEMSLGQRLRAVTDAESDSDDDNPTKKSAQPIKSAKKSSRNEPSIIPVNSLTRTLIQALHSSDARLLDMCLAHSDPLLIRNTIRRLPPQLAVPLITACVERLGRGPRAANMKGTATGATSQRGSGLITWLTTVLAVYTSHLMTIPDMVARLSGLHATLIGRLSLHENLLTLSGKLDMLLSQIELRASATPTSLTSSSERTEQRKKDSDTVKRYIEGDTDSEEDVEVDNDDEGSIEDIELGGDSENDDDEMEEELSGSDAGNVADFIDDEALEDFSEEDSDESE